MTTKIKITSKETEIKGSVTECLVKPFGDSSHVVLPRKHRGRYVNVIVPETPRYSWLLSGKELEEVRIVCDKMIAKGKSKLTVHKAEALESIRKMKFEIEDLLKVLEILKQSPNHEHLVQKIENAYNIK